jgi:hypothetical protein
MRCPSCGDDDNDGPGPCSCGKTGKVELNDTKPTVRWSIPKLSGDEVGMAQLCVTHMEQLHWDTLSKKQKDLVTRLRLKLERC